MSNPIKCNNYTPFGMRVAPPFGSSGNAPSKLDGQGYTGHIEDEIGLVYMQARYYNAVSGRFMSPDPLGYTDQKNLYGYVSNNPVGFTDPTGMYGYAIFDSFDSFVPDPYVGSTIFESDDRGDLDDEDEAQGRDEIRSELYDKLEDLSSYGRRESGYILYEGENGEILTSDLITGRRGELFPDGIRLTNENGIGYVGGGQFGIHKTSRIIEILHTHPDNSAARFSGGEGGDVWFAKKFNFDVSLSYKGERRIYVPTGSVNLNRPRNIRAARGERL